MVASSNGSTDAGVGVRPFSTGADPEPLSIGVAHHSPVFRQGLLAALADLGFATEVVEDPMRFSKRPGRRLLLLSVCDDADLNPLSQPGQLPGCQFVAVLGNPSPQAYTQAICSGAATAVSQDAGIEHIRDAVLAALQGLTLLPTNVVRSIALSDDGRGEGGLSGEEARWLRFLARGGTVTQLARASGFSEREMYRRLKHVYRRLGVETRAQALVRASSLGLFGSANGSNPSARAPSSQ